MDSTTNDDDNNAKDLKKNESARIVPLRKRTPAEQGAWWDGFEAGLNAAMEAITKSRDNLKVTRELAKALGLAGSPPSDN
jgi:hypothetical protein